MKTGQREPARDGSFSLLLPASAAAGTLRFWERLRVVLTERRRPGRDLRASPTKLSPRVVRDVAFLRVGT